MKWRCARDWEDRARHLVLGCPPAGLFGFCGTCGPHWRAVGVSLLPVSYARGSQLPAKVEQQRKHTGRDRNTHTDAVPSFHAQATTHSE